jgi:hypothetical protein
VEKSIWETLRLSLFALAVNVTLAVSSCWTSFNSQGLQGEVSAADLSFAIGATSANTNSVQTLAETADQAAIIAKLNELIQALRR